MYIGKHKITELFLYRWRFIIGYSLVGISLIGALFFVGNYLPGSISNQEMESVIKSSSLNLSSLNSADITNLPYHLLQHASITLFGVTNLSIKLPSLLLALLSIVGIIFILRRWFKPSVGILASLVAITTGQFLFIAQDGTPTILFLFWPVCLLLLATLISYQKKLRLLTVLGFFITAALSMYTPLSIYLIVAFAVIMILHPHLRCLIKQVPQVPLVLGIIFTAVIITPLVVSVIGHLSLGFTLLGIPSHMPNFDSNLVSLGAEFFGFVKPGGLTIMTPFFELGSMLLIAVGIFYVIKTRVTAKNYIIMLWTACLIPLIIINPVYSSIMFLPLVLLLTAGLGTLLYYWYDLFPNNPYARIGGLIPVVIFVTVLIFSGASRFIFGYEFDPSIVTNFSNDLRIIPADTKYLVVADSELDFYNIVSDHNHQYTVSTNPAGESFVATHKAHQDFEGYTVDRIITSSLNNDSDRFYLYTKTSI